jgi:thiol:disulfide interchange protein
MDTFKQIMGFVMIAAAVFFFSTIEDSWKIAVLSLLVGVGFCCWWVGKVPIYAPASKQLTAWISGCAAAGTCGVLAFTFLGPPPPEAAIEWEEFSLARIAQLERENKTVFVDFTADWCANCKTNLKFSVEREDVKKLLKENNVVAMKAEWVDTKPDVEKELKRLGKQQIPVLAVYPAGNPNEVVVLDGLVWKFQVLNAIRQAGPSKTPLEKANPLGTETAKMEGANSSSAR